MKKLNLLLLLFLTSISMNLVLAQESPPSNIPCVFHGTITVNAGNTNFEFSAVTAHIDDGNETLADFEYLSQNLSLGEYALQIENAVGSNIIFKIKDVGVVEGVQPCSLGASTLLDLTATITNLEGSFDGNTQSNIQDLTLIFGESVQFKQGNNTLVTFAYDFDSGILNLSGIKINIQDTNATFGSIQINGISLLEGQTKTVYIDNLDNEDYVCVLDEENASVSEMTGDCSGTNETAVICNGSLVNGYTCTDEGNVLKVTGLTHSAVGESEYVSPSPPAATGGGGGGGGGSGGGGAIITTSCTENWSCSGWSECLDGVQTRVCTDLNSCGTLQDRPEIAQTCTVETGSENQGGEETITQQGFFATITGAVVGALGTGGTIFVAVFVLVLVVLAVLVTISARKK